MFQGPSSHAKPDKERHSNRAQKPSSSFSKQQQQQQQQLPYPSVGVRDSTYDQRNITSKRTSPRNMPPVAGMTYVSKYASGDSSLTNRAQQEAMASAGDFDEQRRVFHRERAFNAHLYKPKINCQTQGLP